MSFTCGCKGMGHDPDCWVVNPAKTAPAPAQFQLPPKQGWQCSTCKRTYAPWFPGPCEHKETTNAERRTLRQELDHLEATDPAVAETARRYEQIREALDYLEQQYLDAGQSMSHEMSHMVEAAIQRAVGVVHADEGLMPRKLTLRALNISMTAALVAAAQERSD